MLLARGLRHPDEKRRRRKDLSCGKEERRMKKVWKKLAAAAAAAAMIGCMAACGSEAPAAAPAAEETAAEAAEVSESTAALEEAAVESADAGETAASGEKLVLGTSADYPPFEFIVLDEDGNQQYVGIDISVAKKLAEDMGRELEVVNMSFDNLMLSLQKGEIDMVIAAVEASEERANVADFSEPYYTDYPPMVLIKADKKDEYTSIEALAGKTVGAQTGTTKATIVTEDMSGSTLLALSSVMDLVNNLEYEKCDAIVLDGAVAMQYAEANDSMVIADISLGEAAPYVVSVQKGDPKGLLESFNKTITTVVNDGTVDKWIEEADAISDQAIE